MKRTDPRRGKHLAKYFAGCTALSAVTAVTLLLLSPQNAAAPCFIETSETNEALFESEETEAMTDLPEADKHGSQKNTENITGTKVYKQDCTVDKNTLLYVREGGRLMINEGVNFKLLGRLKIEKGGSVFVQGTLESCSGSLVSDSGTIKVQKNGELALGGRLRVNKNGCVKGLGNVSVLNNFSDIECQGDFTAKITAPKPNTSDGITQVGGILLINRNYSLPQDYGDGLKKEVYDAYLKMRNASGFEEMCIISGYRSYEKQKAVFDEWVKIDGFEKASRYSAQPGHSEHQSGLAMDISSLEEEYGDTDEGKWLAEHCHEYGFIIRYPKDSEDITGYTYEPWHVRYLGKSTAKLVHDSGLTLEEFLGVK